MTVIIRGGCLELPQEVNLRLRLVWQFFVSAVNVF